MKKSGSVSVKDIAARMNVSLSTVNKALTGKSGISEKRRQEILAVSKEMGYECNPIAQSLARNPITIGVIFPDKWSDYFRAINIGMRDEFAKIEKYKVKSSVYITSDKDVENGNSLKEWLIKENINAVILCVSAHKSTTVVENTIAELSLPVFQVGEEKKYSKMISSVAINVVMAGNLVADFFNCVYGNNVKAVALIGYNDINAHKEKADAFKENIEKNGGTVYTIEETYDDSEEAYNAMRRVYEKYPDVNAVYACTATSSYACRYIEENKLEKQIIFVGTDFFENLQEYMKKGIIKATVFQNQEKLGATVVRAIYDYLVGKNSFGYEEVSSVEKIVINPVLYFKSNIE